MDTNIYIGEPMDGDPEEQEKKKKKQLAMQAKLPKVELADNEEFCISRERLESLNTVYFKMLDDMKAGFNVTPAPLRSLMESAVFEAYKSDLNKMQRQGIIDYTHALNVYYEKYDRMIPQEVRCKFLRWKKRPNEALKLCRREAMVEAHVEFAKHAAEIERQERFIYGISDKGEEFLNALLKLFAPKRKRKRKRFLKENGELLQRLVSEYITPVPPEHNDTEESEDQAEEAMEPDEQPEELKMELVPQSDEIQPPEQTEPPAPSPSGMVGNITYYKFSDKHGAVMYCSVNLAADNITLEKLQEILHAETLEEVSRAEYDAQSEDETEEEYDELDELYELEEGEENENSETALSTEVKPSDDDESAE